VKYSGSFCACPYIPITKPIINNRNNQTTIIMTIPLTSTTTTIDKKVDPMHPSTASTTTGNTTVTGTKRRLNRSEQKRITKQRKKKPNVASQQQHNNNNNTTITHSSDDGDFKVDVDTKKQKDDATISKSHEEYLTNYVSIPFHPSNSSSASTSLKTKEDESPIDNTTTATTKVSSLGKWFPKAIRLKRVIPKEGDSSNSNDSTTDDKNATTTTATAAAVAATFIHTPAKTQSTKRAAAILLFYQYIHPTWTVQQLQHIQDYLVRIGQERSMIGGRIRIAPEGLNVTLSAMDTTERMDAMTALHHFVQDLHVIDDVFRTTTDYKYIPNLTCDRHFHSYHILPVQELVYYGFNNNHIDMNHHHSFSVPTTTTAIVGAKHVPPELFHRLLAGEDITSNENEDGTNPAPTRSCSVPMLTNQEHDRDTESSQCNKEKETNGKTTEKKKDIVVIDVRNHYEAALGRFDGQEQYVAATAATMTDANPNVGEDSASAIATTKRNSDTVSKTTTALSVAQYINPKMRKSTDFPIWVQKNAAELVQKDRILLYCTGGIRCERASQHLSTVLHNELAQYKATKQKEHEQKQNDETADNDDTVKDQPPEIYQLQGGIEKYLQTFQGTGGGFWRGKNFTFDKREAISVDNMNGDGGVVKVVKSKTAKGTAKAANLNTIPDCQCVLCHQYWDRYIGKKKCVTCGVPILVCDQCCSTQKDSIRTSAKCPICIEEQITIPVTDVAYTNNGKQTKVVVGSTDSTTAACTVEPKHHEKGSTVPKASSTVLKWGGGHGTNKVKKNHHHTATEFVRLSSSSLSSVLGPQKIPCKFGTRCHRSDCIFLHPNT
jgi:predicted sulfurtransferase